MIPIERVDPWIEGADPVHIGLFVIYPLSDGNYRVVASLKPDASDAEEASFSEWVDSRFERFVEYGPEPDGWQYRVTDGGWQMWVRNHYFGELLDM